MVLEEGPRKISLRCSMMLHQELAYQRSSMLLDLAEDEEEEVVLAASSHLMANLMGSVLEGPEAIPHD